MGHSDLIEKIIPAKGLLPDVKKLDGNEFIWKSFQDFIASVWKDQKPVFMLRSIHDPVEEEAVTHNAKPCWNGSFLPCCD